MQLGGCRPMRKTANPWAFASAGVEYGFRGDHGFRQRGQFAPHPPSGKLLFADWVLRRNAGAPPVSHQAPYTHPGGALTRLQGHFGSNSSRGIPDTR